MRSAVGSEVRRRRGGRLIVVLVVAALGAAAVATPAAAQEDEPGAAVTVNQIPNRLALSAVGCSFAPGAPVRITFSGGGGDSREFSRRVGDDTCFTWAPDDLDPCRLGASDLPGTKFTLGVEVPGAPYSLDQLVTLDPDTTEPRFLDPPFDASPQPGSKVEVGDEINLEVTATDKTPAPSWQTGVHGLQVTGPQGLLGSKDGGRRPKACGDKSKSLTVQGSHRVRRSDPAVIELCAITEDYVPNENNKCAQWYKGEVWEGTISGGFQFPGCGAGTISGEVTLAVEDRAVSGTFGFEASSFDCGTGIRRAGSWRAWSPGARFGTASSSASGAARTAPPRASRSVMNEPSDRSGTRARTLSSPIWATRTARRSRSNARVAERDPPDAVTRSRPFRQHGRTGVSDVPWFLCGAVVALVVTAAASAGGWWIGGQHDEATPRPQRPRRARRRHDRDRTRRRHGGHGSSPRGRHAEGCSTSPIGSV